MNACTIIAKNYVAYARVLARSFQEHHPTGRIWVLVIDDFADFIDAADEPFEVLTPADIGCSQFVHMALRYSVLELSTAVKPWLLRHMLAETDGPVTYLDPDIRVYGSLQPLDRAAADHGLVLIPHNDQPIPVDGRRPSQVDVMIAGIYNLGYVSLAPRPEVNWLLDWWADRLVRDCRVDPVWGYFVDQRWFDLAPGFVSDLAIIRDPQYNVAYWNLHCRQLRHEQGKYLVNGEPLGFFHFSGFDPSHPLALSRHQDRIDVLSHPLLEQLLADYARQVMASGHAEARRWPYSYGALGNGAPLDDTTRDLYDQFLDEMNGGAPSPFTLEGAKRFERWASETTGDSASGISRALEYVYASREDLRGAFPDPAGADRDGLLQWAEQYGRREVPLLDRLMRADGASATPAAPRAHASSPQGESSSPKPESSVPLRSAPWGVNVVGDFQSDSDCGSVARELVGALDDQGVSALPVRGLTRRESAGSTPAYMDASAEDAPYPVNLLCVSPDELPRFTNDASHRFFAGRYSVGLWFWPVSRFPDQWRDLFTLVEEVWAPTAHVAAALEPTATVPVQTIRIPVPVPTAPPENLSRARFGVSDADFVFVSRCDYMRGFNLSNPIATIDAFRRAFAPGTNARLLLECIRPERDPGAHAALRSAAADHADIVIFDRDHENADSRGLLALCDCYVSLHRAEAFGLALAQAMCLSKPVIATGYSGNLDFMTAGNSHLVEHRLIPIGPGHDPCPPGAVWADPSIEHAAALMRRVFDDRHAARELGAIAAEDLRRTHSRQAAAPVLGRRLEAIRATGRARRPADPARERPPTAAKLPFRVRQGPVEAPGGRGGRARMWIRDASLRAMRPYTYYQQGLNAEFVAAFDELSSEIADVRTEDSATWAQVLAASRRAGLPSLLEAQTRDTAEIKRILTLSADRSLYLALSELHDRHAVVAGEPAPPPSEIPLTGFELRCFSQNGEDGILAEVLRRVGAPSRFFVEFGVESGREGNCVYLADAAQWHGLFMEAGDEFYPLLERKYVGSDRVRTLQATVNRHNIEELLAQARVPAEPDVLSIDVDGQDYWIWSAMTSYRPRVVVIEYNSALDPRRRLVEPDEPNREWDGTEFYGASLGALQALAENKGYRLVHTDLSAVNAFFVRDDLAAQSFPGADEVVKRGVPNYYQRGYRHPPAPPESRYLDLDTGALVDALGRE